MLTWDSIAERLWAKQSFDALEISAIMLSPANVQKEWISYTVPEYLSKRINYTRDTLLEQQQMTRQQATNTILFTIVTAASYA